MNSLNFYSSPLVLPRTDTTHGSLFSISPFLPVLLCSLLPTLPPIGHPFPSLFSPLFPQLFIVRGLYFQMQDFIHTHTNKNHRFHTGIQIKITLFIQGKMSNQELCSRPVEVGRQLHRPSAVGSTCSPWKCLHCYLQIRYIHRTLQEGEVSAALNHWDFRV